MAGRRHPGGTHRKALAGGCSGRHRTRLPAPQRPRMRARLPSPSARTRTSRRVPQWVRVIEVTADNAPHCASAPTALAGAPYARRCSDSIYLPCAPTTPRNSHCERWATPHATAAQGDAARATIDDEPLHCVMRTRSAPSSARSIATRRRAGLPGAAGHGRPSQQANSLASANSPMGAWRSGKGGALANSARR